MNIVEPIITQCRNKPTEVALVAPGTLFNLLSYGRLQRAIENVCHRIISLGLEPGSRAAVFVNDPIFHSIVLLSLARLGVVTVSGRDRNFAWSFAVDAIISDHPFAFPVARIILVDAGWITGDGKPVDKKYVHRSSPDEICRILLTSGTTGEEKAVAVSNRIMAARIDRQNLFFGSRAAFCARTYVDIGLHNALGFQLLLATLWRGGALFLPGDPQQTINALPIYKVQNMIASPRGLLNFLDAVERRPEYQCRLDAVFSGGSFLSEALAQRVRARVCTELTKGYGSTEATMVASMPAHFMAGTPGAVGFVQPGIDVEIVDEEAKPLSSGREGIVRIRSPYGVGEYLGDPEETARVFMDGWFYPGDLGYLTKANVLVISGRRTNVLNMGGDKVNPEKLEEILSSHPNVIQVAVCTVPNELGVHDICALLITHSYLDAGSLREYCEARLPRHLVPARYVSVSTLPVNEMGKIDRARLPDLVKAALN